MENIVFSSNEQQNSSSMNRVQPSTLEELYLQATEDEVNVRSPTFKVRKFDFSVYLMFLTTFMTSKSISVRVCSITGL